MKFSIITCTWNSEATLGDTIRSVRDQTHRDVEQIFVDGGSTDGTLSLIARECPQARVLNGVSGGISRAMNAGVEVATGDVIAHLHSDDYYSTGDVLTIAARAFAAAPSLQWLYGRIAVLRNGEMQAPSGPMRPFTYARFLRGAASVPHPAVFIRSTAFEEFGGFDERLKYAMDIDLWLRMGRRYAPLQIDRPFAVFREHAGSLSTANVLAARAEDWRVRRAYALKAPLATLVYGLRYLRRTARIKRALATAAV